MSAPQGSLEWHIERLGKITGSQVHRLMTGSDNELSSGALTYCEELARDRVIGAPEDDNYMTRDMERGHELEPIARGRFQDEMTKLNPLNPMVVTEVGFINHRFNDYSGVSLDGLTNDNGIAEIKCRRRKGHINQLIDIQSGKGLSKDVHCQVNWGMYITNRTHCYFIGYTNEIREDQGDLIIKKYLRDEKLIKRMALKSAMANKKIEELADSYRILLAHSNLEKPITKGLKVI